MNAFISLARARYSVRKFKDAPISEESLHRILVAGQLAPTACNNQAVHVYVLKSADARAKVAGLTKYGFNAPVILCVCAETDRTWKKPAGGRDHERGTGRSYRCHTHDAGGLGGRDRFLLGGLFSAIEAGRSIGPCAESQACAPDADGLSC